MAQREPDIRLFLWPGNRNRNFRFLGIAWNMVSQNRFMGRIVDLWNGFGHPLLFDNYPGGIRTQPRRGYAYPPLRISLSIGCRKIGHQGYYYDGGRPDHCIGLRKDPKIRGIKID